MLLSLVVAAGVICVEAAIEEQNVLSPAATTTQSAMEPLETVTPAKNSTDFLDLSPDPSSYFLGYRQDDFAKPYAKYWNPNVQPINEAFQRGLSSSPWANALTYTAHEAHEYFTRPGYNELENGWSITENGTLMIAVRSEIPQVTGQAYDWWFSWHSVETARYKLWNPVSHQYSWREPQSRNWTGLSYQDRYINTSSYVDEYVGSNAAKLSIGFIEPESVGFDQSRWPELNIETIVVGQVLIGNYTEASWDGKSYLMHQVRRMPNGYRELRSRSWIAKSNHGSAQLGHDLAVHCNIEMTHLGTFLPEIFQEFRDTC